MKSEISGSFLWVWGVKIFSDSFAFWNVYFCICVCSISEALAFPLMVLLSKNDVCFLVCGCSVPQGLLQMELWLQDMFSTRAALFQCSFQQHSFLVRAWVCGNQRYSSYCSACMSTWLGILKTTTKSVFLRLWHHLKTVILRMNFVYS